MSNSNFYLEKYSKRNTPFEDLYSFFDNTEKWFKPPISQRTPIDKYVQKLIDEAVILLAKDKNDGKIIGLAAYYCTPKDYQFAFLSYIATNTKKKGVGSLLVKNMIHDCIEKKMAGVETQTWESNEKSIALFAKYGFKVKEFKSNRDLKERSVILKLEF